jgi:hypothetical protein
MNPNRLTRELRKVPGNIRSPKLPGGTLVSAVLDRHLMTWSDRGGASKIFGDVWSEHCWAYLHNGATLFRSQTFDIANALVIRLDDNPAIAIQAGRRQLPNPDFLILHSRRDETVAVRAVDAKFAVDRLRRTQVSPESIRELIELPGSLARVEIETKLGNVAIQNLDYEQGAFLGPNSILNDYFFERHTSGEQPLIPTEEIYLLSVTSGELFTEIEEFQLMELFQSIDSLHASTTESELVLGMYYLRLASAARWFANQSKKPLLSAEVPEPVEIAEVIETAENRVEPGESAYGLIEAWSSAAEAAVQRQKLVQESARLPIRMSEIRRALEERGLGEEKKLLRKVRGALEQSFILCLVEQTGEIPPEPEDSIHVITEGLRDSSRSLRQEMLRQMDSVITHLTVERSPQPGELTLDTNHR